MKTTLTLLQLNHDDLAGLFSQIDQNISAITQLTQRISDALDKQKPHLSASASSILRPASQFLFQTAKIANAEWKTQQQQIVTEMRDTLRKRNEFAQRMKQDYLYLVRDLQTYIRKSLSVSAPLPTVPKPASETASSTPHDQIHALHETTAQLLQLIDTQIQLRKTETELRESIILSCAKMSDARLKYEISCIENKQQWFVSRFTAIQEKYIQEGKIWNAHLEITLSQYKPIELTATFSGPSPTLTPEIEKGLQRIQKWIDIPTLTRPKWFQEAKARIHRWWQEWIQRWFRISVSAPANTSEQSEHSELLPEIETIIPFSQASDEADTPTNPIDNPEPPPEPEPEPEVRSTDIYVCKERTTGENNLFLPIRTHTPQSIPEEETSEDSVINLYELDTLALCPTISQPQTPTNTPEDWTNTFYTISEISTISDDE
jgi:hypothetical protein